MDQILSTFADLEEEIRDTLRSTNYVKCHCAIPEECTPCPEVTPGLHTLAHEHGSLNCAEEHSRLIWRRVKSGALRKLSNGISSEGRASDIDSTQSIACYPVSALSASTEGVLQDAVLIEHLEMTPATSSLHTADVSQSIYANVSLDAEMDNGNDGKVHLKIDITDESSSSLDSSNAVSCSDSTSRMYKLHLPVPKDMNLLDEEGFLYILNSVLARDKDVLEDGKEDYDDAVIQEKVCEYFV